MHGAGAPVEIACDESGSEGGRLIGAETSVFTYASVQLETTVAAECVRVVRARIGSPALEYKAGHLLRQKSRPVLEWLLGPSGPIIGRAHVHLTDKTFLLVTMLADLLAGGHAVPTEARDLYREARSTEGHQAWHAFLSWFNDLLRNHDSAPAPRPVDAGPRLRSVMESLRQAPLRAAATRLTLDPLVTALVWTVAHWSAGGRSVSIVHDEQRALTAERIAQVNRILGPRLTGVRFVDSRTDPRVQIADYLAGIAGRAARDVLTSQPDAELVALLRPYVDAHSIWGADGTWTGGPM
jgi:hypothetical protein